MSLRGNLGVEDSDHEGFDFVTGRFLIARFGFPSLGVCGFKGFRLVPLGL